MKKTTSKLPVVHCDLNRNDCFSILSYCVLTDQFENELCLIVLNRLFLFYIVKKSHTHFYYIVWQSSWLCKDCFLLMQPVCLRHAHFQFDISYSTVNTWRDESEVPSLFWCSFYIIVWRTSFSFMERFFIKRLLNDFSISYRIDTDL